VSGLVFNRQNHFIDFDEGMGGLYEVCFIQVLLESGLNISKVLCSALQTLIHILVHVYIFFHLIYVHIYIYIYIYIYVTQLYTYSYIHILYIKLKRNLNTNTHIS
jgi:hypothetical protein